MLCVHCGHYFEPSATEVAEGRALAVAFERGRQDAVGGRIGFEPSSTEAAYDEYEYYTWKLFHWPWQFPRRSWAQYWWRDLWVWGGLFVVVLGVIWAVNGEIPDLSWQVGVH